MVSRGIVDVEDGAGSSLEKKRKTSERIHGGCEAGDAEGWSGRGGCYSRDKVR